MTYVEVHDVCIDVSVKCLKQLDIMDMIENIIEVDETTLMLRKPSY